MGERRGEIRIFVGKPYRKKPLGRGGVRGRVILKWFFKK
jgi:hypothetical protein